MPLTIVNVAYPIVPISRDTVGGTEQIVALLDDALVRRGHHSLVVAAENSKVAGTLVATPAGTGPLDETAWNEAYKVHRATLRALLSEVQVDVLHLHGKEFATYIPVQPIPVLKTLHLPSANYPATIAYPGRFSFVNTVSNFSRSLYPGDSPMVVIPNGIRLDRFKPRGKKDDFVLALGRLVPEKGLHHALDAARRAGVRLILGGVVPPFPEHMAYFAQEIQPRLDADRIFLGPIPLEQRVELLARASCVVVPSVWDEINPLVVMEALASGTPVVARPVGALKDNIEHGRTGFHVDTVDDMVRAFKAVKRLKPADCRASACERFSSERMVTSYIHLYEAIAGKTPEPPVWPWNGDTSREGCL